MQDQGDATGGGFDYRQGGHSAMAGQIERRGGSQAKDLALPGHCDGIAPAWSRRWIVVAPSIAVSSVLVLLRQTPITRGMQSTASIATPVTGIQPGGITKSQRMATCSSSIGRPP
jgi:hypothetical protein